MYQSMQWLEGMYKLDGKTLIFESLSLSRLLMSGAVVLYLSYWDVSIRGKA
jgi:hypothetical protein